MVIDYTISIGNMLQIGAIVGGGLFVLFAMRYDIKSLKSSVVALKTDLESMQNEIKKLGEVLIAMADMRGEIKVLNVRLSGTEQDIRELKHGEGFVTKGARSIDREYK